MSADRRIKNNLGCRGKESKRSHFLWEFGHLINETRAGLVVETSLKDSWLAALMFDVLRAGMFVMMISPLAQSMLAERLLSTHCMLFHVRIKTACGL